MAMSKYALAGYLQKKTLNLQDKIKFLDFADEHKNLWCTKLIYINDLNKCIHFSTTRHLADDTNFLYAIDSSKLRNRNPTRKLDIDLKSLNHWLLANKISLNAAKTELLY